MCYLRATRTLGLVYWRPSGRERPDLPRGNLVPMRPKRSIAFPTEHYSFQQSSPYWLYSLSRHPILHNAGMGSTWSHAFLKNRLNCQLICRAVQGPVSDPAPLQFRPHHKILRFPPCNTFIFPPQSRRQLLFSLIVVSSFMLHIILLFHTSLPFFLFFQCCLAAPFFGPQSTLGEAVNGIPRISRISKLPQIPRSWALFTFAREIIQAKQNCHRAGTPNNGFTLSHNSPATEQARRTMVSPCPTNRHTRYCTIARYVDLHLY
jgi:hypothetical protein